MRVISAFPKRERSAQNRQAAQPCKGSSCATASRNQLVHGYATLCDGMVWEILQTYLSRLLWEITELLKAPDSQDRSRGCSLFPNP
jgi:hypothetical protein